MNDIDTDTALVSVVGDLVHYLKCSRPRSPMREDFYTTLHDFIRRWGLDGDPQSFAELPAGHVEGQPANPITPDGMRLVMEAWDAGLAKIADALLSRPQATARPADDPGTHLRGWEVVPVARGACRCGMPLRGYGYTTAVYGGPLLCAACVPEPPKPAPAEHTHGETHGE